MVAWLNLSALWIKNTKEKTEEVEIPNISTSSWSKIFNTRKKVADTVLKKLDLNKIQEISDYTFALMEEIHSDIKWMSQNADRTTYSKLDEVNRKIDKARWEWVNVDSLDKEILDFRYILFKRNVANKIEELSTNWTLIWNDISYLEKEYKELLKEENLNREELISIYENLENHSHKSELKFIVNDIVNSEWTSIHSIDKVATKIEDLKSKWVDVSDIEEMLFW